MALWDDADDAFRAAPGGRAMESTKYRQWYFEVWNEPNIDFWGGIPRQQSYFDLYAHTARDSEKSVSPRLRVGGPATAAAAWVQRFPEASPRRITCRLTLFPHTPTRTIRREFVRQNERAIPMDERVCRAVAKVHGEIEASPTPHLPLFLTEWNVQGEDQSRDTIFVGPAAGQHHAPMRWAGQHDVVLDLLRCL